MFKELRTGIDTYKAARGSSPHTLFLMEGPTNCNRFNICKYCTVPSRWNPEEASTVDECCRQIDWAYKQGYRVFNYVGGETLAESPKKGDFISNRYVMCEYGQWIRESVERAQTEPFRTKEGITFLEHTKALVEYAHEKGMLTNVTTNGDFIKLGKLYVLRELKEAGLDILTFSLHSYNEAGLKNIIGKARATAQEGIVPIVNVVFTADRADTIPQYAMTCAANGIFFCTGVVQEIGGGFSAVPAESNIPSVAKQREVFDKLMPLKKSGFLRDNWEYLTKATNFPGNSWKCNPEIDAFVRVRAVGEKGQIEVCSEVSTDFQVGDIDLNSEEWRKTKRELVEKCKGCLYTCFYESENPDVKGDLKTFFNMLLIKTGHAGIVRKLGQQAFGQRPDVIPVPESELERYQAEFRDHNKLSNKFRRAKKLFSDRVNVFGALALVYLEMVVKERKSPGDALEELYRCVQLRYGLGLDPLDIYYESSDEDFNVDSTES